jgi:hypothetical protein
MTCRHYHGAFYAVLNNQTAILPARTDNRQSSLAQQERAMSQWEYVVLNDDLSERGGCKPRRVRCPTMTPMRRSIEADRCGRRENGGLAGVSALSTGEICDTHNPASPVSR